MPDTSLSLQEANKDFKNKLYIHDNLYVLQGLNSNFVDLIYLDPPFNSKRLYNAPIGSTAEGSSFKDTWKWGDIDEHQLALMAKDYPKLVEYIDIIDDVSDMSMKAYITYMAQRVIHMKRVMKDTGSIYYHCDPTAGHFVKLMLDCIFGKDKFRNEIVWCYGGGGMPKKDFGRKHDLIFRYSKTDDYYFNIQYKPYSEGTLKIPRHSTTSGGEALDIERGTPLTDHWSDLSRLTSYKKNEWQGYPTQKPLALLDRIIKASCPEGGIVLDPFCGCATSCVSANNNNRHYIGIDIENKAVDILISRLSGGDTQEKTKGLWIKPDVFMEPPVRTDVEIIDISIPKTKFDIKKFLYKQQQGKCNGCGSAFPIDLFDIDHIIPKSHGGGDYMENYQLLCRTCNTTKGNRPMAFLRQKINEIRRIREHITY